MIRKLQVLLERWLFEGEPNCFPCLYQEEPLEQTFGCLSLICYMAWCHLTQGIMGDVEKKRWCWCCTELQYLEAKRDLQPSELTDFMRMWSTSERLDWWRRSWSLQELLAQTVSGLWPFPKWEQLAKNEVVLIRVSPQCETWTCTPYWWKSAALEDPIRQTTADLHSREAQARLWWNWRFRGKSSWSCVLLMSWRSFLPSNVSVIVLQTRWRCSVSAWVSRMKPKPGFCLQKALTCSSTAVRSLLFLSERSCEHTPQTWAQLKLNSLSWAEMLDTDEGHSSSPLQLI